jgi:hypothetical protein
MVLLYSLLLVQDRYVAAPWLFLVVLLAACLRAPEAHSAPGAAARPIAVALVLLLAGLSLTDAIRDLAQRRRMLDPHLQPAYDANIYGAANGLIAMGIKPGDRVACLGLATCFDPYWLWLAGAQMVADVGVEGDSLPEFWNKTADKAGVVRALQSVNAKALVMIARPNEDPPIGWQRLGGGLFFACSLQPQPGPMAPPCAPRRSPDRSNRETQP